MIEINNVSKKFDDITALDNITMNIKSKSIFGLVGSNGAGKSTLMRIISGIISPDDGQILLEEHPIYENARIKQKVFYISDEQYFIKNSTPVEMAGFYSTFYKEFSKNRFIRLMNDFELDPRRKIDTFSKGMKKQLSVILGLCCKTDYILCDETFDGLDPVARQAVKNLLREDIKSRGITPIIASHNLRELEDICDHIGLLHKGGVLLSKDIIEMKLELKKVQCVFNKDLQKQDFADNGINIIKLDRRASLYTIVSKENNDNLVRKIESMKPLFYEVLPLSLEEIFITETEVAGYDIKSIML